MSNLATYYYATAILFIINAICDIIFNSQYSACPYENSAAGIFLFLFILNIILVVIVLQLGFFINYFDGLDPDELLDLGWFKRLIGIFVKVYPSLLKLIHYVKVIFVLIGINYAFLNNVLTANYLNNVNFDNTTVTDKNCLDRNSTTITQAISRYPKTVVVFELIECVSVFVTLVILGIVKNLIDIDGYFYEPENREHGGFILNLFTDAFSKVKKHPSQATRNYRHTHPEMSYNPLPQLYWTGPRHNFATNTPLKYKAYNARLSNIHHYKDTTQLVASKVRNLH